LHGTAAQQSTIDGEDAALGDENIAARAQAAAAGLGVGRPCAEARGTGIASVAVLPVLAGIPRRPRRAGPGIAGDRY